MVASEILSIGHKSIETEPVLCADYKMSFLIIGRNQTAGTLYKSLVKQGQI